MRRSHESSYTELCTLPFAFLVQAVRKLPYASKSDNEGKLPYPQAQIHTILKIPFSEHLAVVLCLLTEMKKQKQKT